MISRRQIISISAELIFAIFTRNESFLGADDRSGPIFSISEGTCHGNRFCAKWGKMYQWTLNTFAQQLLVTMATSHDKLEKKL